MRLAGIILAAGDSRRMGSPKPLLELEGKSFLDRAVEALGGVCDPLVVVVGRQARHIREQAGSKASVLWVRNPKPETGMLGSLQCALRVLPEDAGGVLFTPIDYPLLRRSSVNRLARAFQEGAPARVAVPTCEGRRGHPVCVARELARDFFALPPGATPRDVIHAHRHETIYVEVGDPGILRDVDTPGEFGAVSRART